ncbi:MAG: cytidylate kinase-like family protein [Armatimonadota bacterium]
MPVPRHVEEMVIQQVRRSDIARERINEAGKTCMCSIITISRTMGSGARIIAGKLADDLGWSLWDRDLLESIAEDAHVSKKVAETFDEHPSSEIEMFVRSILGEYEIGGFIYTKHLTKAVTSVAKLGNAIILGRGANIILPHALNIRIDASEEHRVMNMMNYENLTREQAIVKIRSSDKDRQKFMINTFGREKIEKSYFDVSIWMDEFSNDDAVAIIKAALGRRCHAICE